MLLLLLIVFACLSSEEHVIALLFGRTVRLVRLRVMLLDEGAEFLHELFILNIELFRPLRNFAPKLVTKTNHFIICS